nr:MAG TPA: hypothetical protein [Caudoviricetes sp.]
MSPRRKKKAMEVCLGVMFLFLLRVWDCHYKAY